VLLNSKDRLLESKPVFLVGRLKGKDEGIGPVGRRWGDARVHKTIALAKNMKTGQRWIVFWIVGREYADVPELIEKLN
jgi:hypothetical protein